MLTCGLQRLRVEGCVGYLDGVRHRIAFGWAFHRAHPQIRLSVLIKLNGRLLGSAKANRFRSDLHNAGIGDGHCGFEFPLPRGVPGPLSVEAVIEETGLSLVPSSATLFTEETDRALPAEWQAEDHFRQPSLFLLGAAKAGTTSLHSYLGQHPDIFMSDPKEPFYFEAEYESGAAFYFNRYFSAWSGQRLVGESRHRNLYLPYVPERIYLHNPDAKLIAILRNPVERAVSHWWHWYSRGQEPLPLKEALQSDEVRIRSGRRFSDPAEIAAYGDTLDAYGKGMYRTYLDSGYYAEQVHRYAARFGSARLHVIMLDDFRRRTRETLAGVFEFLECDPTLAQKIELTRLNESSFGMLAHVTTDLRSWLLEHYRPHNQKLEQLLNCSLQEWEQPFE